MSKINKLCLMIFTLLCFIAIGVCVIVDYAINNQITWGIYPILSVIFGYLIITPLFLKKQGIIISLCSLTITILPYLYLLEKVIPNQEWFYPLAFLISVVSIIGIWITYFICKVLKIDLWNKILIVILMWGVILAPIINNITDGTRYLSFQNFINVFAALILAAACGIYGYARKIKIKNNTL